MTHFDTNQTGVKAHVEIDWMDLGGSIADASSPEQANFLEGWADAMSVWKTVPFDMQLQFIADEINDPDKVYSVGHIRRLLSGLLERIPEVEL